jgi:beta-lactamase regulating signal transducer with metallopeptidase domain
MMTNELSPLLAALGRSTVASSLAVLVVMAMRRPLRKLAGAGAAYPLWLAVPLCALATLLPAPATVAVYASASILPALGQAAGPVIAVGARPFAGPALLFIWLSGAIAAAMRQASLQRRFARGIGRLSLRGDGAYTGPGCTGPALVGILRPLAVVPADFDRRYSTTERELILAHERAHARRRDPLANAACAALQCLWWFNPLIHLGARRMRIDQELACDADVMRSHPRSRRAYAGAMMKSQLAAESFPLACQWQSNHPLKERIMNLNRRTTSATRAAGRILLAAVMIGASYASWAAQQQASASQLYNIALKLNADGLDISPRLLVHAGEKAGLAVGEGAQQWKASFVVTAQKPGTVYVATTTAHGGEQIGQHGLLVALGDQAGIKVATDTGGALEMKIVVTEAPAK